MTKKTIKMKVKMMMMMMMMNKNQLHCFQRQSSTRVPTIMLRARLPQAAGERKATVEAIFSSLLAPNRLISKTQPTRARPSKRARQTTTWPVSPPSLLCRIHQNQKEKPFLRNHSESLQQILLLQNTTPNAQSSKRWFPSTHAFLFGLLIALFRDLFSLLFHNNKIKILHLLRQQQKQD